MKGQVVRVVGEAEVEEVTGIGVVVDCWYPRAWSKEENSVTHSPSLSLSLCPFLFL